MIICDAAFVVVAVAIIKEA